MVFLSTPDLFGKEKRKPFDRKTQTKLESLVDKSKTVLLRTFPDVDTDQLFQKVIQLMKGEEGNSK